ncbi:MAG: NYN domain-containing protein [Candidatus Paceibacterota bacterium]
MAIIKHPEQRVGVFIDTQNLYHSAKNLYHARVNFGNLLKDAVAGRRLIRARAYVVTTESGEEKGFFEALAKIGIETRTKDLQIFFGGAKKADWDVGMAVDAITMAPKLDTVILFTGDGDFIPLVEYLRTHGGCQVEVVSFGRSTSGKLKEATDHFLDLDQDPKRYLLNYRGSTRRTGSGRQTAADKETGAHEFDPAEDIAEISKITGVE